MNLVVVCGFKESDWQIKSVFAYWLENFESKLRFVNLYDHKFLQYLYIPIVAPYKVGARNVYH